MLEDDSGRIWAMGPGLWCYDGVKWRDFLTSTGYQGDIPGTFLVDRAGDVWLGGFGGVWHYDGQRWGSFTTQDGLGGYGVVSLLEDRLGNIWAATNAGVSRYDGQTWTAFTAADGVGAWANCLFEDRAGDIWTATAAGVSRFDGQTWKAFTIADGLGEASVFPKIAEDRSGNVWVISARGVSRYDGTTWRHFTTADGLAEDDVYALLADRSGNLWVGTLNGVSRFDGYAWRNFTASDVLGGGLSSQGSLGLVVWSMLEDHSGNVWVGTQHGGASRYDGQSWRIFTSADGLVGNGIRAMLEDHSGSVWLARGGGVSRYDGRVWQSYTTADGLAHFSATVLLEDHSGNLWVGTEGGASRFDGQVWKTFTETSRYSVTAMIEDRSGNLWVGTYYNGVIRYDGQTWHAFTSVDGLGSGIVNTMLEDHSGHLWVGTEGGGVSRFDGQTWQTFTTTDGIGADEIRSVCEDRSGNVWVGTTYGGVSRYDGHAWKTFTVSDGLPPRSQGFAIPADVTAILEDRSGHIWISTLGGVASYDGAGWRAFTAADEPGDVPVLAMLEDRSGNLWIGTYQNGVSRYDGNEWWQYTKSDGLGSDCVLEILESRVGSMWFGTCGNPTRYDPDRVPPRTVIVSRPLVVNGSRTLNAGFVAAFGEAQTQFSTRLDSSSWSPWSPVGSWSGIDLPDGRHSLQVRARDRVGNIEATPALAGFDVDATPPPAVIEAPAFGQAIRATVGIRGSAADARFRSYSLAARTAGASSWSPPEATILTQSTLQVSSNLLATWDTSVVSDGLFELRLSVVDSLGLVGVDEVTVLVDNHFPFVDETAPATISAAAGGDLYTNDAQLHLYFPPHAFHNDALVSISTMTTVADTLASGAIGAGPGYHVSWSAPLDKVATMGFSNRSAPEGPLAVYYSSDGVDWSRLGGTREDGEISLAITTPGEYALFTDLGTAPDGGATLSPISFTPRVFSHTGSFAQDHLTIGFTLGKASPVTVRVYNRAGRLVREVVSGQAMLPGASLVRWDGRDRGGVPVADGIYIVTVEALGQTRKNTLAVVR